MEGGSLFNPGFIGGSFIWWLGQIADNSSWRNNEQSGKFETAEQIKGFGKRYRVRIIGVHDKDEQQIPSDQLPWANIMYPVTAGAGQGDSFQTANLRQGMFVFGFYMDGQDMQVPVIMGVLGNNAQTELHTKIGNNDSNFAGTSGFAQGQEDIKGPAKSIPKDEGKGVTKPKPADVAKEQAALSGQQDTTSQGISKTNPTREQQRDLESAKAEVESMDPAVKGTTFGTKNPSQAEVDQYIKEKVTQGMQKRVDFANSPGSPAQPGATLEGTGSMMQVAAADIKLEDKYNEKTVVIVPDKVVESAIKAIQTISENLTAKMEKSLSSLGNYADAVSGAPKPDDMQKLIKDAACQMAKYMKIIMDKIMEYSNKNLKEELSETLSEMPSCMRYQMGDMMNVMNEKSLEQYNNITETICGQLEGTLSQSLDIPSLVAATQQKVAENVGLTTVQRYQNPITGKIVERTVSLPPIRTRPDVPMCSAESIVGTAIANVKGQIDDANNKNVEGVSRYLEDLTGELERMDADLREKASDESTAGAVLSITDAEVLDNVIGGTKYKTTVNVGTQWRDSTVATRKISAGFGTDQATGQGLVVDIIVSTGGLGGTGSGSIDFTWINNGTGYPHPSGNQLNVSGGTGTGMKVNVQTDVSGVITSMFTHTTGTGYKLLDNNQEPYVYTIQSGNFDAKFKLDAVWGKIDEGGIRVNKRGVGYVVGDVYTVLSGSGDGTFTIVQVADPGNGKAESSDPKPLELGSMISKLPGLSGNGSGGAAAMPGNLTSALDFKNIAADIFPFELPPNPSPVDFVTLANGGEGQTDSEIPNMDSIRNNIANNIGDVSGAIEQEVPFLTPKTKQVIDLVEGKVKPS